MKYLFFLLTLITSESFSQTRMTGLGKFKIDSSTTEILNQLAAENNTKVGVANDLIQTAGDYSWSDKKHVIISLLSDSSSENEYGIKSFPDTKFIKHSLVKSFYINFINLPGITLERVYLFFYSDTLYKIQCNLTSELIDAMNIKYGPSGIRKGEKIITCRSGVGIEYNEIEANYYYSWDINNSKLECIAFNGSYFDSQCKKNYTSSFMVYSLRKDKLIATDIIAMYEKKEKEEADKKKSKLKDF